MVREALRGRDGWGGDEQDLIGLKEGGFERGGVVVATPDLSPGVDDCTACMGVVERDDDIGR